jgi:hypothetical protein
MPNPSMSIEVTKLEGDGIDQPLMDYVSFRQGTYSNYSTAEDHIHALNETMAKSAHYVQHEMPTDTLRTREDCQSILELATRWLLPRSLIVSLTDHASREWTGYGTPENRDSALERWASLTSSAPDVSRRIKAQAHSCLAVGWFDRAIEDAERWNIDSLYRAGSNADEAISLGLVSPGTLRTGFAIETQGFRRPEDNRFPGLDTDRFEQLTELWEAIDARTKEMNKASAKRDGKVARAPLKYICSAADCGIQATKKSGLLRCAGKCPVVFKPSYCSKECQKVVCRFFPLLAFQI